MVELQKMGGEEEGVSWKQPGSTRAGERSGWGRLEGGSGEEAEAGRGVEVGAKAPPGEVSHLLLLLASAGA